MKKQPMDAVFKRTSFYLPLIIAGMAILCLVSASDGSGSAGAIGFVEGSGSDMPVAMIVPGGEATYRTA